MSAPVRRIVAIDDEPANLDVLADLLEPHGYELVCTTRPGEALKLIHRARPILVLLDVMMPEVDGFEVCRRIRADTKAADIPVIFITGRSEVEATIDGFRAGAVDYISKPFSAEEVIARVATHASLAEARSELAAKNRELAARVAELGEAIARRAEAEAARADADERLSELTAREARRWGVAGLVGRSAALGSLLREVERLQPFGRVGVLLVGESGTGKELVARALHNGSPRASAPFIPVNCVAVPAELMESMFFGHVKGAFTGATSDRKGYFELADGGTLFLDEIGDMPAPLQAKLLRVLEDGRVTPVGSAVERRIDVRIIAATNANLEARIESGAFRRDLYFRLARTLLRLPPLRERRDDLPFLAAHFIRQSAKDLGLAAEPKITREALDALHGHDFPGNVRELRNLIENAVITCGGGPITAAHLHLTPASTPAESRPRADAGEPRATTHEPATPIAARDLPFHLETAEQILIQRAIHESGGNISQAARLLGIHRMQIYRILEASGAARADD